MIPTAPTTVETATGVPIQEHLPPDTEGGPTAEELPNLSSPDQLTSEPGPQVSTTVDWESERSGQHTDSDDSDYIPETDSSSGSDPELDQAVIDLPDDPDSIDEGGDADESEYIPSDATVSAATSEEWVSVRGSDDLTSQAENLSRIELLPHMDTDTQTSRPHEEELVRGQSGEQASSSTPARQHEKEPERAAQQGSSTNKAQKHRGTYHGNGTDMELSSDSGSNPRIVQKHKGTYHANGTDMELSSDSGSRSRVAQKHKGTYHANGTDMELSSEGGYDPTPTRRHEKEPMRIVEQGSSSIMAHPHEKEPVTVEQSSISNPAQPHKRKREQVSEEEVITESNRRQERKRKQASEEEPIPNSKETAESPLLGESSNPRSQSLKGKSEGFTNEDSEGTQRSESEHEDYCNIPRSSEFEPDSTSRAIFPPRYYPPSPS
ncbi:hypothetical protein V2G26_017309 [Clonostachys chloroleuca]